MDLSVAGTVHSHPSGALHPSEADVTLFRHWGRRHLILGWPFEPGCWRAYDGNGEETSLEVRGRPAAELPTESVYRPPRPVHRAPAAVPDWDRE